MKKLPVALQLFTIRDQTEKDFAAAIKEVAQMGYQGVEFAGFGGLNASEMKTLLEDNGLIAAGAHVPFEVLRDQTQHIIEYALEIGMKHVSVPYLMEGMRPGQEGYGQVMDGIGAFAPKFRQAGIRLLYHNHDFEFVKVDGQFALDLLYQTFPPDLLAAEIDTYWVKRAGQVPAEYIRKYPGRVPIVHLKDMEDTPEMFFTEVGSGTQDLAAIFAASEDVGAEWYVVEQDLSRLPAMQSARVSRENLKKLGL